MIKGKPEFINYFYCRTKRHHTPTTDDSDHSKELCSSFTFVIIPVSIQLLCSRFVIDMCQNNFITRSLIFHFVCQLMYEVR